jgi:ATP-binding cassette subfamily F protein uup
VIENFSTMIFRGDKVGVIGANAAGKTTLIRLLLGQLQPIRGTIRHGTRLEVAYFDQLKVSLDEDKTVQQNLSDYDTIPMNGQPRHIISYLEDFLFAPERSRCLVKFLSGGERSRLLLARLFAKPSNVLVLDEPTNDLDIETLELLESLLVGYQGTVLLVSHDRAFLNEVVTSTLAIEPNGLIGEYDGGYDDYLCQRPETLAAESKIVAASEQVQERIAIEKRKKLSFKEKREMEALPGQIESIEAELRNLHATMADSSFYKQDRGAIAEAKSRLDELEQALAVTYERWAALEGAAE